MGVLCVRSLLGMLLLNIHILWYGFRSQNIKYWLWDLVWKDIVSNNSLFHFDNWQKHLSVCLRYSVDADMEDYGFEYSDEEQEEQDVDIENQYYNSKGIFDKYYYCHWSELNCFIFGILMLSPIN